MKNTFILLMNILFLLAVSADVIAVKFDCETTLPQVTKSAYQELQQAQNGLNEKTADMTIYNAYKL